jgi:oxygen-independent coproporphyrinogen III oxidase
MNNPGLYIHIPFCLKKCPYCDFYSMVCNPDIHETFISALLHEITQTGPLYSDPVFDTIYIGGGTTNILEDQAIKRIIYTLKSTFYIAEDSEITLELNPECVRENDLNIYKASGVNRVSLGTQSFVDEELKFLGRIHTVKKNADALELIRSDDVFTLSCDLITGLPGQTEKDVLISLNQLLSHHPEHVSVYTLTLEEGTPFYYHFHTGTLTLPDEEHLNHLWLMIHEKLTHAGYEHYEISNYALPGFKSRHNSKYWNDSNYLGFGPSAHSKWDRVRSWNRKDLYQYIKRGPVCEKEIINDEQWLDERLMLGLRTQEGFDLRLISNKKLRKTLIQKIHLINRDNKSPLLFLDNQFLKATPAGWCVLDTLIEKISTEFSL